MKYGKSPKLQIGQYDIDSKELSKPDLMNMKDVHFRKYQKEIQKGHKRVKYDLEIGHKVLIFNPPLSNKLAEKWHPGYQIVEKIEPDAYLVEKKGKKYRVNKAHVKRDFSYETSNRGEEVSYIYSD